MKVPQVSKTPGSHAGHSQSAGSSKHRMTSKTGQGLKKKESKREVEGV